MERKVSPLLTGVLELDAERRAQTLIIEADSDLRALSQILDGLAASQLRCSTIKALISLDVQRTIIELDCAPAEQVSRVVRKLQSMPCVRSVTALPNGG